MYDVAWVHAVCTYVSTCVCHGMHVDDRGQPWVLVLPSPPLERQQRQRLLFTAAYARPVGWRASGSPGPNLIFQKDHRDCRWVCYCSWLWSLKILKNLKCSLDCFTCIFPKITNQIKYRKPTFQKVSKFPFLNNNPLSER